MLKRIVSLLIICTMVRAEIAILNTPLRSKQPTPNEQLAIGIVTASPAMVQEAIKNGAQMRMQLDQFGDTPLMLAIRMFGHSLKSQVEAQNSKVSKMVGFAAGLVVSEILVAQLSKFVPDNWQNAFNVCNIGGIVAATAYTTRNMMKPWANSQRLARIVLMLLQQDVQSDLRNYECLAPKDILEAFYPIARTLQSEEWFALRRIFSQIHP